MRKKMDNKQKNSGESGAAKRKRKREREEREAATLKNVPLISSYLIFKKAPSAGGENNVEAEEEQGRTPVSLRHLTYYYYYYYYY